MQNFPDENSIRNQFEYVPKPKRPLKLKVKESTDTITCSKVFKFLLGILPIVSWLPKYSVKNDLVGDLIGGTTTAIVRMPQSLAYGLLAGIQPINGLYTAFFAPLTYAFLGTSKHVSVGTFAIVSMMIQSMIEDFLVQFPMPESNATYMLSSNFTEILGNNSVVTSFEMPQETAYRLKIVSSLTCLVGIIQIAMGFTKLGFVALFLSDPLVSAFTCASAFHVFTTQIKSVFGIHVARKSQPFAIIKTYVELFSKIVETNIPTLIVSIVCIIILYPVKIINQKYKKALHNIPIPIELFVVILSTALSSAFDFASNNQVAIVGSIESGLPSPLLPDPSLWKDLISGAFSIAIVSFAMTVSLGKLFAKKHNYLISPNHELFALGVSQMSCCFFQGVTCAGALSRSLVKESSGTKSQIANFISCAIILLVLLVIGPYLAPLPKSCLACIIIVNLRSLFLKFQELPRLWDLSKMDFFVWIVTFSSTLLLGVDSGLILGVAFLLVTVVLRMYHPDIILQGRLGQTEVFGDMSTFKKAQEVPGVKIIRYSQSPFFANKEVIQKLTEDILKEIDQQHRPLEDIVDKGPNETSQMKNPNSLIEMESLNELKVDVSEYFHTIIFDCSPWTIMDVVGMEAVRQMCRLISSKGIAIYLVSLQPKMVKKLEKIGVLCLDDASDCYAVVYPNMQTAVSAAIRKVD